jgi:hypothetical protein
VGTISNNAYNSNYKTSSQTVYWIGYAKI